MSPAAVAHGTAETLARVLHFRGLTDGLPDAHELDPVIRFLIGSVTDPAEVLEHLSDELDLLWSLITEDFSDDQLDELTEAEWDRVSFDNWEKESDHRWARTVARLSDDIENYIRMAREWHAQQRVVAARTGVAA